MRIALFFNRALFTHLVLPVLVFSSCASNQKVLYADDAPSTITESLAAALSSMRPERAPREWERPSIQNAKIPAIPENILGKGKTDKESLSRFLLKTNPFIDKKFARDFAEIYIEEAAIEGVNHDVAFSQMCLETGFLVFGGLVKPDMNNFCGLGSTGPEAIGERFPSPRIGVRAQIQHLKAYATDKPLTQKSVDPRRHLVRAGSAPTIYLLAGSWAEDLEYGKKIKFILDRLYIDSFAGRS